MRFPDRVGGASVPGETSLALSPLRGSPQGPARRVTLLRSWKDGAPGLVADRFDSADVPGEALLAASPPHVSRSNREGEDPGLVRERGECVRPPIALPESPPLGERRLERAWDPNTLLCVFHLIRGRWND